VAENNALGSGGAPSNHVLVRSADIGADDLEDDPVFNGLALWILELGVIDGLDFNLARSEINNSAIACCGKLLCDDCEGAEIFGFSGTRP
jgi:hypothetical protein